MALFGADADACAVGMMARVTIDAKDGPTSSVLLALSVAVCDGSGGNAGPSSCMRASAVSSPGDIRLGDNLFLL